MLRITLFYDKDMINILANGHTGYAEEGKDIVCAAISALLQTFILWLEDEYGKSLYLEKRKGVLNFKFPADEKSKFVLSIFLKGLKEISKNYPKYVKLEEVSQNNGSPTFRS
ncbi:MAG: ribosomal-processing cysteine protease Prp [Synergistetes bacterium]|nr:ribosomal-processing cysteine protease Prp [Synergistota bacterium]MCX8128443.1 ribosomal-processing cysteine protease Prp [Synergistota bacterium]MDW8193136.1 ribosomal-processing cysteine protease Prp [Synergistota bacterium]